MPREKKPSPLAKKAANSPSAASKSSSKTESIKAPPPSATAAPVAAQPKQPGLLAQAASTAGGVAIGSSVGHAVGGMLTSKSSSGEKSDTAASVNGDKSAQNGGPCDVELRQLMDCINRQPELNACQTFFETLKQCRTSNGLPSKGFQ